MVAADDDRRRDFAVLHHFVEGEAEAVALAESDPANPRRQALEGDSCPGHVEPTVGGWIVGGQLLHACIRAVDVPGITRKSRPAERADASAEEGPNVGGHEAGE